MDGMIIKTSLWSRTSNNQLVRCNTDILSEVHIRIFTNIASRNYEFLEVTRKETMFWMRPEEEEDESVHLSDFDSLVRVVTLLVSR